MRVLQHYKFKMGTKIPFPQWPDIVKTFLRQTSLHHRGFGFYLEDFDNSDRYERILNGSDCEDCRYNEDRCVACKEDARRGLERKTACHRAAKENPFLGQVHFWEDQYSNQAYLSNLGTNAPATEDQVLSIVNKLYRRYGFSDTELLFLDVDFFDRHLPAYVNEELRDANRIKGSYIRLFRSVCPEDNEIELCIDLKYGEEVLDASLYAETMAALLPGIKRKSYVEVVMDPEEKVRYQDLNQDAKPLAIAAKEFFQERMPEEKGNDEPEERVSVPTILKKLCKQYDYTYEKYEYYTYRIHKRTARGHYITLEFISSPSSPDADPNVIFQGVGFYHRIWADGFSPQNKKETTEYMETFFRVLNEAEETVLAALDTHYPPTPQWYVPPEWPFFMV